MEHYTQLIFNNIYRLYSKLAHSLTRILYTLPATAGVFLAFTVPGYLLTGLHYPDLSDLTSFYTYLGYMVSISTHLEYL